LNQTDLGAGSKPMRVYLNEQSPPVEAWDHGPVDVFGFENAEQVPDWAAVNSTRMIETIIKKPMNKILGAIDMDVDAAIKGQQQAGISRFV
jgi:DNA polymerase I